MSRLQRSPPAKSASESSLPQVMSDSDIPRSLTNTVIENVNVATRHKRLRPNSPPTNDLENFKHEILEMLTTWKKEQETQLIKLSSEQTSAMSKLAADITELKLQNIAIQKSNMEIEKSIGFINKQYEDMLKRIEFLEKERHTYLTGVQTLQTNIQDLQQSSRSSSVEIRNVLPTKEGESVADLTNIVVKVGTAINVNINNKDIRDIYRLPGKPGVTRPIVTEFVSVQTKHQFLASVRDFNKKNPQDKRLCTHSIGINGERRPLYVAEYLPPSSRKLFFAAREFAKTNDYNFCWTTNGNIFLRKVEGAKQILVKSEQCLRELQAKQ